MYSQIYWGSFSCFKPRWRKIFLCIEFQFSDCPVFDQPVKYNIPLEVLILLPYRGSISRQEKVTFFSSRRVALGLPSPSRRVCPDRRTDGRTDGRTLTQELKFLASTVYYPRCFACWRSAYIRIIMKKSLTYTCLVSACLHLHFLLSLLFPRKSSVISLSSILLFKRNFSFP